MKPALLFTALVAGSIFGTGALHAAEFTYHGSLQEGGKPAEGKYDLELTLYSTATGGSVIGGPLTMYDVPVHEGSFSAEADFGPLAKLTGQAYVAVKVRSAGQGDYAALDARSSIAPDTNTSCPGSWSLDGNAGNPAGSYLGNADNQPLIFKVNSAEAGRISPGKGVAFAQGGFGATANGQNAFATGNGAFANGAESFAGGFAATATGDGSFMWGDSNAGGGVTATTAANQYIVRAGGGVGINSAPLSSATEVTIRGSSLAADTNADIAIFPRGSTWGYDVNVQGTGQADASWNISQTNGSTYTNRLSIRNNGVVINDPANIPANSNTAAIAALNVVAPAGSADALIDMYPHDSANPTLANYWSFLSDKDEFDVIRTTQSSGNPVNHKTYMTMRSIFGIPAFHFFGFMNADSLGLDGNIDIGGSATKPGGGPWLATSDRRIKQDIAPINDAIDTLLKLRPVSFHYTPEYRAMENNLPDKPYLGFIAQEFAQVFPEAVISTDKHVPGAAASDPKILALDANPALITTVAAVQELAIDNKALQTENADLRGKLNDVLARLSKLEAGKGK